MNLHFDGWDSERGAYRVVRTYTPPMTRHNFAWFVEEAEARRFCRLMAELGDADGELHVNE